MRPASSVSSEKKFNQEIMNKRPKSAIVKFPLINNSKIRIKSKENHKDENKEKVKLIPYKIGKEQLYEDTVHLKIAVNKLRSQLDEAKSTIVQKDLEIKQKNKIIEDCTRDNDVEVVHKENIEKGKESTLISSCKKKYYEMKKLYRKKCEENDILKAHIKITKIKDLENENIKLQNELIKIINIYLESQEEIEGGNKQISDLNDYKNKFIEQHILLSSIQSSCKQLNKDNSQLKSQLNQIGNEKEKKQKETKKLRTLNMKLKFTNGKLLLEKKQREQAEMKSNDYEDKKRKLNEKLSLLVNDYKNKGEEIRKLNNLIITGGKKEDMKVSKTIKQSEIIIGENEKEEKKNELIKSLLKDAQFKVNIYEKYLNEKNYNISRILRKYNYNNGLMNSHSIPLNINSNPKPPSPKRTKTKNNFEDRNKNVENEILQNINVNNDENQYLEEKEIQKYRPISKEEKKIDEEDKLNDLSETLLNEIQNALPQIMRINLEAKKITKDKLEEQIKIILDNFEKMGGEISKDDFIEPFRQLLIENMKITKENDVQLISSFLENLLEQYENDIDKYMEFLNNIFSSLNEFSENDNEKLNKLKFELNKYPSFLNKIKEKDTNKNYIISYLDFGYISSEVNLNLDDDLIEFLLYKMKKTVPDNYSIFDLNYKIIEDLKEDNNKIIEEHVEKETDSNEKLNTNNNQKNDDNVKDKSNELDDNENQNQNENLNENDKINNNENENSNNNNENENERSNYNNENENENPNNNENENENPNIKEENVEFGIEKENENSISENQSEKFEIINDEKIDDNLSNNDEDNKRVNNILKEFKQKIKDKNQNLENIFIINEYIENEEEKIEVIEKKEFIDILKDNDIQLENDDEEKIYSELKLDDKFNKPDFLNLSLIKKKIENEEL
jgi:hypothetical protein